MKNLIKNKKLIIIVAILSLVIIINFPTSNTPKGAVRSRLFSDGHPVAAFITPIIDDKFHNKVDKETLKSENAQCYKFIFPVRDKFTGNSLTNCIVRKKGSSYYAEYYGEG